MEPLECFQAVSTHKGSFGVDPDVGWSEGEFRCRWGFHLWNSTKPSHEVWSRSEFLCCSSMVDERHGVCVRVCVLDMLGTQVDVACQRTLMMMLSPTAMYFFATWW